MKIIVGLGNPGEKYARTRHNAGFMAVDALAKKYNLDWKFYKKYNSEITGNLNLWLVKPQTFINNSGKAVQDFMSFYKLLPKFAGIAQKNSNLSDVLTVIHDDIYIELGKSKISIDSRSAGHNGVESIINHLKTKNFKRIRIGVKTNLTEKMPSEKFVLENFNKEEIKIIDNIIKEIINTF